MTTANQIALNKNFLALEQHLSKFNIFHATDMGKREIKHTKFLAYLLNPRGAHGLGSRLLIEFIRNAFRQLPTASFLDLRFSEAEISCEMNLGDVYGRIDILIYIPTTSGRTCIIAIENKLEAQQGNEQLAKYQKGITNKYPDDGNNFIYFFYLIQKNVEEAREPWILVLHEDITIPAIQTLLDDASNEVLSSYLKSILTDYIEILRADEDFETAEVLASKIPSDFLTFLNNPENESDIRPLFLYYPSAVAFLKQYQGCSDPRIRLLDSFKKLPADVVEIANSNINYLRCLFLSDAQKQYFKSIAGNSRPRWIDNGYNLALEFVVSNAKIGEEQGFSIYSKFVLGPTNDDFDRRQDLVATLRQGLAGNQGVRSQSNKFSVICRVGERAYVTNVDAAIKHVKKHIQEYKENIAGQINGALTNFFGIPN